MAKGFGGVPGNMQAMLRKAQQLQQDLQIAQDRAKLLTAKGTAGGGVVQVVAGGDYQIKSLTIEKEVIDSDDVGMLQDLVVAAVNEALKNAHDVVEKELSQVTGGINIPGLM